MITHTIHKGFDVRIAGRPAPEIADTPEPVVVAVGGVREFAGIKPKLLVAEGDTVKTGEALFFDKNRPDTHFVSPVTGTVTKVFLGERRRLRRVEITPGERDDHAANATIRAEDIASIDRDELITAIQRAGLWPLVRQRPIGKIADPEATPVAVYVNGMDTEPLAADPAVCVRGLGAELQAGLQIARRLSGGPVYLTVRPGDLPSEFQNLQGAEVHAFAGPHPAGLVGTHINEIAPLKASEVVWYLKAQELALIGQWALTGQYPTHRVVALAGTRAHEPRYHRIRQGAAVMTLTGGKPLEAEGDDRARIIAGTVLNGPAIEPTEFLGTYTWTVTIIPEGEGRRDMFGWALPQLDKHSASRAVFSWLKPKAEYDLDARMNGGPRAIVNIGAWERVLPLDIHPTYLVRAIQANDLEEAISLGLLEVTEEDMALCTFVDPCKIDIGPIIRDGLDLYEAEG